MEKDNGNVDDDYDTDLDDDDKDETGIYSRIFFVNELIDRYICIVSPI